MSHSSTSTSQNAVMVPVTKHKPTGRFHNRMHKIRMWVNKQHPSIRITYKILVALFGLAVIITGLILVPLPGPGWLIVVLGLALLGTEFPPAQKLHDAIVKQVMKVVVLFRKHYKRYKNRK
jgi:uncharacterized protein (TIGR02611 family)